MAIIDILLPKMGESVAEATITKLVVDAGSSVDGDDPIVEIATDKVDSEVPAPEDGVLGMVCRRGRRGPGGSGHRAVRRGWRRRPFGTRC